MTAASERARLGEIGRDLAALAGDGGERRAHALLHGITDRPQVSFADLAAVPVWLRRPRPAIVRLACEAALVAMGPAIAASIDGAWLGALEKRTGEAALDTAIGASGAVPGGGLAVVHEDQVDALGFDLMRAALPLTLHRYLEWAPTGHHAPDPALAAFCLAEVTRSEPQVAA